MPRVHNFGKFWRGDTISGISITGLQQRANDAAPWEPIDLTGVAIDMHIVNAVTGDVLNRFSVGQGFTLVGTDGFSFDPFTVEQAGVHGYDIQFTFAGGVVQTWYTGTIEIEDDITRP